MTLKYITNFRQYTRILRRDRADHLQVGQSGIVSVRGSSSGECEPEARVEVDRQIVVAGHNQRQRTSILVAGPVDYGDRKSTRLNSSHSSISYAVFCLKKKIKKKINNLEVDTRK